MKLKLNEVKWLVPGDPSNGRTRAISLQVPSSSSLHKPVSPALPLTSYMSLGKSCLSPWASVSLTENERRALEVYDCDPVPSARRPHVTWGRGEEVEVWGAVAAQHSAPGSLQEGPSGLSPQSLFQYHV